MAVLPHFRFSVNQAIEWQVQSLKDFNLMKPRVPQYLHISDHKAFGSLCLVFVPLQTLPFSIYDIPLQELYSNNFRNVSSTHIINSVPLLIFELRHIAMLSHLFPDRSSVRKEERGGKGSIGPQAH